MTARPLAALLVAALAAGGAGGCGAPRDDLETYVAAVKQRKPRPLPVPQVKPRAPTPLALERDPFVPLQPAARP